MGVPVCVWWWRVGGRVVVVVVVGGGRVVRVGVRGGLGKRLEGGIGDLEGRVLLGAWRAVDGPSGRTAAPHASQVATDGSLTK